MDLMHTERMHCLNDCEKYELRGYENLYTEDVWAATAPMGSFSIPVTVSRTRLAHIKSIFTARTITEGKGP